MLSALSHSSLANSPSPDPRPQSPSKKGACAIKTEPDMENNIPGNQSDHDVSSIGYPETMDYNADEIPVHPLAPAPSSTSNNYTSSSPSSSSSSFSPANHGVYVGHPGQPQQHQQLLKLKTEHGVSSFTASGTPDIAMSGDEQEEDSASVNMEQRESSIEEDDDQQQTQQSFSRTSREKESLVVDTTSMPRSQPQSRRGSVLTPMSGSTPSTDTPTSAAPSSSRRPSLRTMTTLPRSALQEETIALFKQYRDLIPCAKCFSRKTIQRDGMSDGNLRFKCRPPVSMNLICNKSYSESKIRNMIAGVVYGNSLPDGSPSTPGSSGSGSQNVLAMAPPPSTKGSRRSSRQVEDSPLVGPDRTPDMDKTRNERDQLEDFSDIDRDGMSPGVDHSAEKSGAPADENIAQRANFSRRPSAPLLRRGSTTGEDDMRIDRDSAEGPSPHHHHHHPNYLQVPGTPPLDSSDPRLHRPWSANSDHPRSVTPTGTAPGPVRNSQKLRHSQSHPNIGQQRLQQQQQQQSQMDSQDRMKEHRASIGGITYPSSSQPYPSPHQQQRPFQPLALRRESSQLHGSIRHRPEPERRSSHPIILQSSSPSTSSSSSGPNKYLPVGHMHDAHSPIIPSSPRASPSHDSMTGLDHYHRRMSQPYHTYSGHGSLPPPHPSPLSNQYDRNVIDTQDYHHHQAPQREGYEPHGSPMLQAPYSSMARYSKSKGGYASEGSPRLSHSLPEDPNADDMSRGQAAMTPPIPPHSSSAQWSVSANSNDSQEYGISQTDSMRYPNTMPSGATQPHHYPQEHQQQFSYHSHRSSLRQEPFSSTSPYLPQQQRRDDPESPRSEGLDLSPDFGEVDADGRPIVRMPSHGLKSKSSNHLMSRRGSSQNLYGTNVASCVAAAAAAATNPAAHVSAADKAAQSTRSLTSALPQRSTIKLTRYSGDDATVTSPSSSRTLETTDALAVQVHQSSKLVIEITQPRFSQAYHNHQQQQQHAKSSNKNSYHSLARFSSQPNLLMQSSTSILGRRRSASPDTKVDFESSKKRRAAEPTVTDADGDPSSSARSLHASSTTTTTTNLANQGILGGLQIIGLDYSRADSEKGGSEGGVGLGLGLEASSSTRPTYVLTTAEKESNLQADSPCIEALSVAQASSYALVKDQKEMGVDYSLFTRVETAGWRILIPPNVTASFRSEDFGLVLKPKEVDARNQTEGEEDKPQQQEVHKLDKAQEQEVSMQQSTIGGNDRRKQIQEEEVDKTSDEIKNIALDDKNQQPQPNSRNEGKRGLESAAVDDQEMHEGDTTRRQGAQANTSEQNENSALDSVSAMPPADQGNVRPLIEGEDVDMDELDDD
ncbi:hypothetical protein BGZ94_002889 [Podila epigama]|nr:hypothetical protein BGZ94_002889 [Podila epigama]